MRSHYAIHEFADERGSVGIEDRIETDSPVPAIGQCATFHRVLLRHQHWRIVVESDLGAREYAVIGIGVFHDLEAGMPQAREKCAWIADRGKRMNPHASKGIERACAPSEKRDSVTDSCVGYHFLLNRRRRRRNAGATRLHDEIH